MCPLQSGFTQSDCREAQTGTNRLVGKLKPFDGHLAAIGWLAVVKRLPQGFEA